LSNRLPGFPIFSYLDATCATARGEREIAQVALARTRANDAERRELKAYGDRLQQIAEPSHIAVLDLDSIFSARGSIQLLSDSVHPTPAGHTVIAEAVAEWLMRSVMGR
jgi:lysophospholipase L1-like esterase